MIQTSAETKSIIPAICGFQYECPVPTKDKVGKVLTKTGREYSYSYSDLGTIISTIGPTLKKFELFFIQPTVNHTGQDYLVTRIYHKSGEWIESSIKINDPNSFQDLGSQLTYKKRYQLCSLLGIVAEDDTDGVADKNPIKPSPQVPVKPQSAAIRPARVKPGITDDFQDWNV